MKGQSKLYKKDLLHIRDLINEMESSLDYKENVELCVNRISDFMTYVIFDRED